MGNFSNVIFCPKNKNKEIFNNVKFWNAYAKKLSSQVDNLGWWTVWNGEHSQRGLLLQALVSTDLPTNKHPFIEFKFDRGRADLIIADKSRIEIIELKDKMRFTTINSQKKYDEISFILKNNYNRFNERMKIDHEKVSEQLLQYIKEAKKLKYTVEKVTSMYIYKVIFDTGKSPRSFNSEIKDNFTDIYSKLVFNAKNDFNMDSGFMWIPTNPSIVNSYNMEQIKRGDDAFFLAPHGSQSPNKVIKLFGGIMASWRTEKIVK